MALSDLSPLTYFKELHLLPRVIFTIGGALFFSGLFIKDWKVLLVGMGIVFIAVGYNFLANLLWHDPHPPYTAHLSWSNLFQAFFALAVAACVLYVAVYDYRYGVLPRFLQPIKNVGNPH